MYRLLIVEDDAVMRSALTLALKGAGYETESAENGLKALELAAGKMFHCIISDIRMPGLDGVSTISRFKETFPKIKTILITGYSDDEPLVRAANFGVDGILKKPFGMKELLRMVSLKMEEHEKEKERERLENERDEKYRELALKLSKTLGEKEAGKLLSDIFPQESAQKQGGDELATLVQIGRMAEMRQEYEAALQAYEEALSILSNKQSDKEEFPVRLALSNLFAKKMEREFAFLHADEALTLAQRINEPSLLLQAHLHLGKLFLEEEPVKSSSHLQEARALLEKSDSKEKQALSSLIFASLSLRQGKMSEAKQGMAEFFSCGKRHFLPQLIVAFQEIALAPFLLSIEERMEMENALWVLEEIAPFLQEKLKRAAERKPTLQKILSGFLAAAPAAQTKLQVSTFGKFNMLLEGKQMLENHWKSLKGRSVFLYLFYRHPVLVSEEHLLDTFWPNLDPGKGKHNFRTTLYLIRRTLGENGDYFIYTEKQKFGIKNGSNFWCDFLDFKKHYEQAKSSWEKGNQDRAILSMREAEKLYKGAFLEGWSDEWCLTARDDFKEAYVWMMMGLSLYLHRQKEWNESFLYAQKALRVDETAEEAYFLSMSSLLETGRREEAVRQFHNCKMILKRELGVEPSQKTQQLYLKAAEVRK